MGRKDRTFEDLKPSQNCVVKVGCNVLQWQEFCEKSARPKLRFKGAEMGQ